MKRINQLISQQKAINESMEEARTLKAELIEIGERFRQETGTGLVFTIGRGNVHRYAIKSAGVFEVLSHTDHPVTDTSELRRIHTFLTSEVPE